MIFDGNRDRSRYREIVRVIATMISIVRAALAAQLSALAAYVWTLSHRSAG
jgi:hypothetical protein